MKKKKKSKPRRVVLGSGFPWFNRSGSGKYINVGLTKAPVPPWDDCWLDLKFKDLGNWNKVRLVAEVVK